MNKKSIALVLAAALAGALTIPALAQTTPDQTQTHRTTTTTTTTVDRGADTDDTAAMGPDNQYGDPICGAWASSVWQANGHCPGYVVGKRRARVAGTITAVKGHLVTLQQADKSLVINDQPALNRQTSGHVAVGRQLVAFGYWRDGNFYATAME
ncbi:MAG TPA: hypothetical protein VIK27_07485 [Candidatus Aquilonibacter sp.]